MSTHAKRERLLLADLLETAGPDAPTCARAGQTRDLAAHVVVRERRPDAAGGIVLGALSGPSGAGAGGIRRQAVRGADPADPYGTAADVAYALKQIDEAANTVEFYVHAEDVRRAQPDWTPRELDQVFAGRAVVASGEARPGCWAAGRPVGLVLRRPDGQTAVAHRGTPVVTVTGEPGELTLFAFGRQDAAPRWSWRATRTSIARLHEVSPFGM